MIPLIFKGKEGLVDVMTYGIYNAVSTFNAPDSDVVRQVLYTYMNSGSKKTVCNLPKELQAFVAGFDLTEEFSFDEYRGFSTDGKEFNPLTGDMDEAIYLFENALNDNPKMKELAIEFYRIRQGCNLLGITISDIDAIRMVHEKYRRYDGFRVFGQAKLKFFMNLYQKRYTTEEERVLLAAYISLRSIMGKKTIDVTDKEHVLARMMGKVTPSEISETEILSDTNLASVWKRYNDWEYWRRLLSMLRGGYVKHIQPLKDRPRLGTFFTFSRDMSEKEFISQAEKLAVERKKEKALIRKRVERKRKRTNTFKPISIPKTEDSHRQTKTSRQPDLFSAAAPVQQNTIAPAMKDEIPF